MDKTVNSPKKYFVWLLAVAIAFELFVTLTSGVFSNLTDRIKLKAAMFNHRKQTEILFIGTSRFKDGVVPSQVLSVINQKSNLTWSGFNGATTGTNLKRLNYFFETTVEKQGLKVAVIEVSMPQFVAGGLGFNEVDTASDVESTLQRLLAENSSAIKSRKSFRIQNLANIVAILGADKFEGSEWFRAGGAKDFFSDDINHGFKSDDWHYDIMAPNDSIILLDNDTFITTYQNIAATAIKFNIKLIFVIPPLAIVGQKKECTAAISNMYQALSNKTQISILDYSHGTHPDSLFYDRDSHLNKQGRMQFSAALGSDIAKLLKNKDVIQ